MSKLREPAGRRRSAMSVMREHEPGRRVDRGAADTHIRAIRAFQQLREPVIFRHRWHQHDAKETQPLDEAAHVIQKGRTAPVAGPNHQFVAPAGQGVQNAQVDVLHILRVGIVMNHAHEKGATKRETAGLRVGLITMLGDDGFDPGAGLLADVGRLVDDARDGLL